MFSKIRKLGSTLFNRPKYSFAPKKSLKQKMRTEVHAQQKITKSKQQTYLHVGLYGFVFACCFAALPLYRTFCEHMGLVGNNDKKTYQFKNKQIINLKKFIVKFKGQPQPDIAWEFQPVEKEVVVGASETAIVFYRLRNREERPIVGFSTYNISPEEVNIYFSKIQCFCFNQQMINPHQELLLPLFFYLEPEINEDPDVGRIHEITVNYQFHESNNQDLAKFAQEEVKRVQDNKRKLALMRAKKENMELAAYESHIQDKVRDQEDEPVILSKQSANKLAEIKSAGKFDA